MHMHMHHIRMHPLAALVPCTCYAHADAPYAPSGGVGPAAWMRVSTWAAAAALLRRAGVQIDRVNEVAGEEEEGSEEEVWEEE